MSELLQEYVDSGSQRLRVDRQLGIIRGVKLLGLESRNGRRYLDSALAEAAGLYEGSKVNVNHPKGHPLSPRDYQDRLGVIRGVRHRAGEGLFGDLHCNPKHTLTEQLMWDAEHAPQNVGLSHNVLARTATEEDGTVVHAINKVQSIDLVADPATTRGLFEHRDPTASDESRSDHSDRDAPRWDRLTLDQLRLHRPDLVAQIEEVQATQLEEVRSQLDELRAREAVAHRRRRIVELLQEHELPLLDSDGETARQITSAAFVQQLMTAADDAAVQRLVEERAALVRSARRWEGDRLHGGGRPKSRDQLTTSLGGDRCATTAQEFAAAVRGA